MKTIAIILMMSFALGVNAQQLIKTSTVENYKVNPTAQAEINQILQSITIDFLANEGSGLIRVKMIDAYTDYASDTTYRFLGRKELSEALQPILAVPQYAALINGLKTAALQLAQSRNNAALRYDHDAWATDSILYEIIR